MNDREKLIYLLEPIMSGSACEHESGSCEMVDCRMCQAIYLADHLIANGAVVQKQGKMDSFEAVDKFRDELMNKFMKLCNYNDFNKLRLEKIADTVNDVYDKCIDDLLQTTEQR